MRSLFAQVRSARDILCNRVPAALAMLKARDVSIAIRHRTADNGKQDNYLEVTYYFDENAKACSAAYRRVEYLYEMTRDQFPLKG